MLALAACVLFVIGLFVYGATSGWAFWLLLGLAVLALSHAWDYALPAGGHRHDHRVE